MERLSGMDAAFLYMETPSAHMHIVGTVILDPSTMAGGPCIERIENTVMRRLISLPRFRQRVQEVSLGLDHPVLVETGTLGINQLFERRFCPAVLLQIGTGQQHRRQHCATNSRRWIRRD